MCERPIRKKRFIYMIKLLTSKLKKSVKLALILVGAVLLTSFSIDAADTFSGRGGTMLAQLIGVGNNVCPAGMVHMPASLTFTCVDKFEASAGDSCQLKESSSQIDSEVNIAKASCTPVSVAESAPWVYINREQASILCTRAGKRLPTASEWYQFSIGTNAENCNISSTGSINGESSASCLSAAQVVNTVGNVWEWVADDVIEGEYQGRRLPETGYVTQVDNGGVATITTDDPKSDERGDYFWSDDQGTYGMIRGGFYGSRSDAGVYTLHAHTLPTFSGAAIGFRCVR
jgi:hypothetical protein